MQGSSSLSRAGLGYRSRWTCDCTLLYTLIAKLNINKFIAYHNHTPCGVFSMANFLWGCFGMRAVENGFHLPYHQE